MHLEGTYTFNAAREIVWGMLQDPNVIGSIMPGSHGLEQIGENQYQSVLEVKVGPVNGRFESTIELADINAPESYKLLMTGKGPAGHVTGEGIIRLTYADGVTTMHYNGDAKVGGRIAAVGQRLLDVAAKSIAKQSLNSLAKKIEERINE